MAAGGPEAGSPSDDRIEAVVDKRIDARLAEYKRIAKAVGAALALVFTVLLGNRYLSESSLVVTVHDLIFDYDDRLHSALSEHVAVSYSNHFWLDAERSSESIAFYAGPGQRAEAIFDILHHGTGTAYKVSVRLDEEEPFFTTERDRTNEPRVLLKGDKVAHDHMRSDDVHFLVFSLEDEEARDDRVLVRVLIKVLGREKSAA